MIDSTPTSLATVPSDASRFWALIPCAGTGSRALGVGVDGPKQYQPLAGQAMVLHTLAAFAAVPRLRATWVVVAPGDDFFVNLNATFFVATCGGNTRAESVFNGLTQLLNEGAKPHDWVLVHDAARCLITPEQIDQLIDACQDDEIGGLLALALPDTLKQASQGRVAATLDRADKWLAQTPQMFRVGVLRHAMAQAQETGLVVTDEASAVEALGLAPRLVKSSAQNFKVTYPEDFALASAVLAARQAPTSTERKS
jgi:2-C-methyl-D-erythritol 4-phosphate cytidylyltransferase